MNVTTHYGSKLKYLGPSQIPGLIEVETEDLYKTTVLIADLREAATFRSDAENEEARRQKLLAELVG